VSHFLLEGPTILDFETLFLEQTRDQSNWFTSIIEATFLVTERPHAPNPLRNPMFRAYLLSRLFMMPAMLIVTLALTFHVYDVARRTMDVGASALVIGYFALVMLVPLVIFIIPAGSLADRADRRAIIVASLVAEIVLALALAGTALNNGSLILLAVLAFGFGMARAFHLPASQAVLPSVCSSAELPRAMAMGASLMQLTSIGAPFVAGFLYAAHPAAPYAVGAGLAALSLIMTLRLNVPPTVASHREPGLQDLMVGLTFIWRSPLLRLALALELIAALFGGVSALMPAIARDLLHLQTVDAGTLRAASAIGGAAIALYMTSGRANGISITRMAGALIIFCCANALLAFAPSLLAACILLVISGAGQMMSGVIRQNLILLQTPDSMRGRVGSASTLFAASGVELGSFESGVATRFLGLAGALLFGGVVGTAGAIALLVGIGGSSAKQHEKLNQQRR
jgi:MFS family permease